MATGSRVRSGACQPVGNRSICVQCWFRGDALRERRGGYSVRSDGGDEAQMWAVVYDDGMSLTTASERIARSLAEAERQRGRRVTVRRLDDAETDPRGVEKPARPPGRARGEGPVGPRGTDKPSVPCPSRAVGGADSVPEPEPIRPAERLARPKPISEPESAA